MATWIYKEKNKFCDSLIATQKPVMMFTDIAFDIAIEAIRQYLVSAHKVPYRDALAFTDACLKKTEA